jgi:putative hemolysin
MQYSVTATILFAALLCSCGHPDQQVAPAAAEAPEQETKAEGPSAAVPSAGIANPASENCIAKGGELEMQNSPKGQFGVCIFDDGSRCEEWRLFRGECQPGDCRDHSGKCD